MRSFKDILCVRMSSQNQPVVKFEHFLKHFWTFSKLIGNICIPLKSNLLVTKNEGYCIFGTQIMFGTKFMFDTNSQDFSRLWVEHKICSKHNLNTSLYNLKCIVPNELLVPNILSHKSTGNADYQWSLYLTFAVKKIIRLPNFDLENINNTYFREISFFSCENDMSFCNITWTIYQKAMSNFIIYSCLQSTLILLVSHQNCIIGLLNYFWTYFLTF